MASKASSEARIEAKAAARFVAHVMRVMVGTYEP
jgi:hypothetical protein